MNPFTGAAYSDALSRVVSALVEGRKMGLEYQQMLDEIARQERRMGLEEAAGGRAERGLRLQEGAANLRVPVPGDLQSYAGGLTEAPVGVYNASYPDWLRAKEEAESAANLKEALGLFERGLAPTKTVSPAAENYAAGLEAAGGPGGLAGLGPTAAALPTMAREAGTTTQPGQMSLADLIKGVALLGKAKVPGEALTALATGLQTPYRQAQTAGAEARTRLTQAQVDNLAADNDRAERALASKDAATQRAEGIRLLNIARYYDVQADLYGNPDAAGLGAKYRRLGSQLLDAVQAAGVGEVPPGSGSPAEPVMPFVAPKTPPSTIRTRPGGAMGQQKRITGEEARKTKATPGAVTPKAARPPRPLYSEPDARRDRLTLEDYWTKKQWRVPGRFILGPSREAKEKATASTKAAQVAYDRLVRHDQAVDWPRPGSSSAKPTPKRPSPPAAGRKPEVAETITAAEARELEKRGHTMSEIKKRYRIRG